MSKYIDADKLKSEIERLKGISEYYPYHQDYSLALNEVLSHITSLQQEQPELPSNLDEAAEKATGEYVYNEGGPFPGTTGVSFINGFKAGAEWQKEQVLKDAVEGKVYFQIGGIKRVKSDEFENSGIHLGDKVRIIIVKEE